MDLSRDVKLGWSTSLFLFLREEQCRVYGNDILESELEVK